MAGRDHDIGIGEAQTLPTPGKGSNPTPSLAHGDTLDASSGDRLGAGVELAAGTVLGNRYEIRAKLGAGGMGAVYAAYDRLVDQEVALKFVHAALATDSKERTRLRGEVKVAQQITHVNIARTFTLEEVDGHLFIVMELLRGRTLAALLKERKLSVDEALRIARDILLGLAAAHGRGVVHRDIKPANITVCDDGRVAIMDFGLARTNESIVPTRFNLEDLRGHTHTALGGTPGYIAPEIVRGQKADVRADLYSFGVVLFELFAGRPPFTADTPLKLLAEHVDAPPPDLGKLRDDAPPHVVLAVDRLLAKDPAKRQASADEVMRELDPAPPAVSSSSIALPKARNPWPMRLAVGLGLIVGGTMAVVLALPRRQAAKPAPAPTVASVPEPPPAPPPPPPQPVVTSAAALAPISSAVSSAAAKPVVHAAPKKVAVASVAPAAVPASSQSSGVELRKKKLDLESP